MRLTYCAGSICSEPCVIKLAATLKSVVIDALSNAADKLAMQADRCRYSDESEAEFAERLARLEGSARKTLVLILDPPLMLVLVAQRSKDAGDAGFSACSSH